jgi:hypothetical protein
VRIQHAEDRDFFGLASHALKRPVGHLGDLLDRDPV